METEGPSAHKQGCHLGILGHGITMTRVSLFLILMMSSLASRTNRQRRSEEKWEGG